MKLTVHELPPDIQPHYGGQRIHKITKKGSTVIVVQIRDGETSVWRKSQQQWNRNSK